MVQLAGQADRLPHLIQVVTTPLALGEMQLERPLIGGLERPLDIVGHELDDLPAAQVRRRHRSLPVQQQQPEHDTVFGLANAVSVTARLCFLGDLVARNEFRVERTEAA